MSNFPARTRQILDRVLQKRLSKAEAARRLEVSRKTIYKWVGSYAARPTRKESFKRDILRIVTANPEFGPKRISEELAKREKKTSGKTVWLILCEFGIQVRRDREIFAEKFRMPKQAADPSFPGHLRLSPEARKRIVEDVLLLGKKVSEVVGEYHISRKTLAKWKRRYLKAQSLGANLLDALADQHPLGSNHPRGVSPNSVKAVLDLIISEPQLSTHKIAKRLRIIGNHGVQRVLERAGLSHYEMRLAYSQAQRMAPQVAPVGFWDRVKLVWEQFIPSLAPAPPPKFRQLLKPFLASLFFAFLISFATLSWIRLLGGAGVGGTIGLTFATLALFMGSIFFLYSLKYYLTLAIVLSFSQRGGENGYTNPNGNGNGAKRNLISWILGLANGNGPTSHKASRGAIGLEPDLAHVSLKKHPFVSIHIPLYNEKNVVERAIQAASNFDYPEYEIILADDSTDETSQIIRDYQKQYLAKGETLNKKSGDGWTLTWVEVKPGVILKHLHRTSRSGFKGGALRLALKISDPRTEFVSVFDADFVPYPDSLELFLKYFKVQNNMSEDYKESKVAAVQGYQWHVLNKSENWITRGIRSEYAGSYVIERSGAEIYSGLKQISGAVYMIRRDVLEEVGWGTSITEDFELTLRLYAQGYKVVYTPYIQAPAECVSTLKRLIRQRMRWAEGHSNNVKRMFKKLLLSPNLERAEKLEFLYLSPYYLQAFFFLVGTISWLISETIFQAKLPFWTSLWGWSLVLTNFLSLPLMNAVGLFLEESEEKDYSGLFSFVTLSYLLVPFQAYASLKGFLQKVEGPWFRTPKTGKITDIIRRGTFYRLIAGILPGRSSAISPIKANDSRILANDIRLNSYIALATANSRFSNFEIKPRRKKLAVRFLISFMVIILVFMNFMGKLSMQVQAQDGAIINEKYDTRLLNVPKEYEKKQLILDKKIGGELSKVLIDSKNPTVKFIVDNKDNQDYWVEISLNGGNLAKMSLRKYQVIWKDIFPNVDIEYEAYDGFLKENIYLKNNKAQREFIYKIKTSENVALDDSKGGYIMARDRTTSKDLFMLKSPQGIDKRNNRIDYKYRLDGDNLTLYPNRPWQFESARYPILIDPPVSVVEWYEALVKVGENCANTGCEKDGDVIDIRPAGWMWGIEERKDFVIVKIPVLTDEEVKEFVSRTIRPPEPDDFENPQEVKDPVATLPASEREKVFDTEGLVRYGIDYTKIADPDTLKEIRDKNGDDNPVLDSSQDKNIIKKKDNPLASIIPNERRLAYDLNLINRKSFWEKIVKDVRAAGTITTSIGSSGRDYSTISAWETAQQGNLVTLQEIHRGEMYKDSTFVLSATQTIDGSTTDSSYYMHLTAAATERHNGTAGTGVVIDMNDGTVAAVAAFDPNTIVEWLEMRNKLNAPNGSSMIQSNVDGVLFQNLLIHDFPSVNSTRAWRAQASGTTLRNTIIYDGDDQGLRGNIGFAVTIQNLTIWGMGNGIFEDGGTFTITNTIAMNNTRDFDIDNGSLTNVMCQVNDADCNFGTLTTCTNCLYNRNNSTQFVDTNYATANFHLKTGSDAIDAGTTIAGFSDDIDSDTRPIGSAWDIGADEIPENLWGLFFLVPFFPAFLKRLQSRKKLALARVPDKKGN